MIKKILLTSLIISQLAVSCSSDDNEENGTDTQNQSLTEQIAAISKLPYSKLTPSEQKIKLETEANDLLVQLDKTKGSSAIEAIENLTRLLSISPIAIFDGKETDDVEDILNISGAYGIYTWDDTDQSWTKTASTTELKFVFPAKETQTANNASFTSNSTPSDVKVIYDSIDQIYLPTASNTVLTIDGTQAATFAQTAKYPNGNEVPSEFAYKMTLNDGYSWEISSAKGTESSAKASFSYNGKNLIEFNSGSTADIDALLSNETQLNQYRGKANGLINIMDNFAIVIESDLVNSAIDKENLEKSLPTVDYSSKDYYTNNSLYNQKSSQGKVDNFNKNVKAYLVSKKDGTKIADIIQRSEKIDSYTNNVKWVVDNDYDNGGYWEYDENSEQTIDIYSEVSYLKFNDNTEVEMGVYFSEGFDDLLAKFEDFIAALQ